AGGKDEPRISDEKLQACRLAGIVNPPTHAIVDPSKDTTVEKILPMCTLDYGKALGDYFGLPNYLATFRGVNGQTTEVTIPGAIFTRNDSGDWYEYITSQPRLPWSAPVDAYLSKNGDTFVYSQDGFRTTLTPGWRADEFRDNNVAV